MSWMDLVHERREPIIFVHGMTQNCRCWTVRSLIYETFDSKDKDVWLANNRMADGFSDGWWRYEIEDMAMRDMPQITQKVLDVTGYEKVDIVGYSRGNASCSTLFLSKSTSSIAAWPITRSKKK
jgi:pimeloyl-ACP methyl ester carboxylesterase